MGMATATAGAAGANAHPASVRIDFDTPRAPLELIDESPFNPRKTFAGLTELGMSLAARWLVPLLVRPHPKITGRFELVDGARRYRAAKLAKIAEAPYNLVHMSDEEVMIAQHVSYLREDLPVLEQAEGYRLLMAPLAQGGAGLKVEEVAKRIGGAGMSRETVYARMKCLDCIEPAKDALRAGTLTAGHAVLLARLDPKQQARGLDFATRRGAVVSVRELGDWIEWEVRAQKRRAELKARPKVKRSASQPAVDWQARRAKEEAARQREQAIREAIFAATCERVKAPLERADLEFVALALINDRRGDDFATELQAIPKMKPQALAHVLIELAVADELEAYGSQKPDRLLALAKRYKVNVDAIRKRTVIELDNAAARAQLEQQAKGVPGGDVRVEYVKRGKAQTTGGAS